MFYILCRIGIFIYNIDRENKQVYRMDYYERISSSTVSSSEKTRSGGRSESWSVPLGETGLTGMGREEGQHLGGVLFEIDSGRLVLRFSISSLGGSGNGRPSWGLQGGETGGIGA